MSYIEDIQQDIAQQELALNQAPSNSSTPLTQPERFQAFLKRGRFNDLDKSITLPNFHFDTMGIQCVPAFEIVAVTGKAGTGKSTTMAILVGILIGRTEFAGIRCLYPAKKVLWIDTEKGEYTCKQKMKVFRRVAGLDDCTKLEDVGVHFYLMRQETTEDRRYFIDELAKLEHYDVIVIDGIFDLTEDPDKDYAPVTDLLRRLADRKSTVMVMLHTNKKDDNMRYALGTEIQRLCTTRFTVDFKYGVHTITHDKSNDTALAPQVTFVFDKDGNVVSCVDKAQQADIKELADLMTNAFSEVTEMTNTELKNKLMELSGFSESTADRRIREAKKYNVIQLTPDGRKYTITSPTVTSTPLLYRGGVTE